MKINREYPQVTISDKGKDFIEAGNNWVYEDEILSINNECKSGDIVDVIDKKNKYLGSGFYNSVSKIKVRIFSRDISASINDDFFIRRVKYAIDYRYNVLTDLNNYRVVYGEADGLPGLTVDKYNKILVTQITSVGIEIRKDIIFKALLDIYREKGTEINAIYERNDVNSRQKDGLPLYKDYYYKGDDYINDEGQTLIEENGIKYYVDYINGQKTGFFLDQKHNRELVGKIAKDKRVLDCFTHTGSFAFNCIKGGAKKVTAVDISPLAIEQSKINAMLNGYQDKIEFVVADVFDYLDSIKKRDYDLIILDPPAFAKSREVIMKAYTGYKNINAKAMSILGRGGYLVSASCSHFISEELYLKMLLEAAKENNLTLKLISYTSAFKDHPIILSNKQTDYLKFYILQLV